ncbi:MAG: mannose-6-phosphate isomerase, partial [Lactococcus sp.]
YALSKGDHFILPTGIDQWQLSGNMEIIASNPVAH